MLVPAEHSLPTTEGIVRSYCAVHQGRVTSILLLSKGLLTLRYAEHKAIADRMRTRARIDCFYAKERRLAQAARRLRPLFWIGRILMPEGSSAWSWP
jgi:hypothetical protein